MDPQDPRPSTTPEDAPSPPETPPAADTAGEQAQLPLSEPVVADPEEPTAPVVASDGDAAAQPEPTPVAAEPTPAAPEPTPVAAEPTPAAAEPTPAAAEQPADTTPPADATPAGVPVVPAVVPPAAPAPPPASGGTTPADPPAAAPAASTTPAAEPAPADPVPADATADEVGDSGSSTGSRLLGLLPLALLTLGAVLLAAGTVFLFLQAKEAQETDAARRDALAKSRDAARVLFSYNHETLEEDFAKGLSVTTGDFREEYSETTQNVVRDVATQYKAVVKANVSEAGIISASPDVVEALVFLNQETTSTRVEGTKVDQSRVRMRLVERDGTWLVEDVAAL